MSRKKAKEHSKKSKLGKAFLVNRGTISQNCLPKEAASNQKLIGSTHSLIIPDGSHTKDDLKAQKKLDRRNKKFAGKHTKKANQLARNVFGDDTQISLNPDSYNEQHELSGPYESFYRNMAGTANVNVNGEPVTLDIRYTSKRTWRGLMSLGDKNTVSYWYNKKRIFHPKDLKHLYR